MGTKHPKICLLGASFATNNLGVNALTAGTLKAFIKRYPDGELFLLDYGKNKFTYNVQMGDRTVPVHTVNIRFSKQFYLKNNITSLIALALFARCIPFPRIRKRVLTNNFWLNWVAEADIVASLAGGDSFSDIYGTGRFLYAVFPQLLALCMGKKLVLLPQTIGPFHRQFAKCVARFILRKADIIYSRDFDSMEYTRKLLGLSKYTGGKLRFCYDMGFILDPVTPAITAGRFTDQQERERPLVGLNISGLLYMGGYSQNNMFGLRIDYKEFIRDLIEFLIEQKNTSVVLIPHVFGSDGESDSVVCDNIYTLLAERYNGRLLYARGDYNQSEIKHIIGLCDFFIGSRMHACIAALSQSVPTVSIAYSRKFAGVMNTIHLEDLVADPCTLTDEEILGIIDKAFEQRSLLRSRLKDMMPSVKETVLNLFDEIAAIL